MRDLIEETIVSDTIEKTPNGSVLQHGKHNDRIYLMKLHHQDMPGIFEILDSIAKEHSYAKIFCKVPLYAMPLFLANGFIQEAHIPNFYQGKEDVFFLSKFRNSDRLLHIEKPELESLSLLLKNRSKSANENPKPSLDFQIRRLNSEDVDQITDLYKIVFETYPFPIHKNEYIIHTMQNDVQYYGVEVNNKIVAISSSEMDVDGLNAEMTDFATHPDYSGHKLATHLLMSMEKEMQKQGIKTLYTIARLASIPMNKTFLRQNYQYTGTLIKNTNISGNIESMNIYYKQL